MDTNKILVVMAIFLLSLSVSAFSADVFFPKLIENTEHCIDNCYAVYEFCNPSFPPNPIPVSKISHKFYHGKLKKFDGVKINKTVTESYKCVVGSHLEERNRTYTDNKTGENITEFFNVTVKDYGLCYRDVEKFVKPDSNEKIPAGECRKIKISGSIGLQNAVDWQPTVTRGLLSFTQHKWAWWNSSYSYKMPINCTNMDDKVPLVVNGSSGFCDAKQIVWTYCSGTGTALYYNTLCGASADYVVANDTDQLPMEVEMGNASSYQPTQVYNYLTGHSSHEGIWHFREGTGQEINSSEGNDNNATTAVGGIGWSTLIGNAGNFSNDHMKTVSNPHNFNNLTVLSWVSPVNTNNTYYLWWGDANQYSGFLSIYSSQWRCNAYEGTSANDLYFGTASTGTHLIVCATNGTHWVGYVDGDVNGSTSFTGTVYNPNSDGELRFGSYWGSPSSYGSYYSGVLDEVWLLNRTMSSSEVNQVYNNVLKTPGYGDLGAEETQIVDTAPTAENLTLTSPIYTETSPVNCSFDIADSEGDTINVTVTFYNDTASFASCSWNNQSSGTSLNCGTTDYNSWEKNDVVNCTVDLTQYDDASLTDSDSTTVTVSDTPPTDPTDITGFPANLYVGDTLTMSASGGSDVDGDTITYHFKFYNMNDSSTVQDWSATNTYTIQTSDAHNTIQVFAKSTTADANSSGNYNETDIVNDSAPTLPSLSSPSDGNFLSDSTPSFDWTDSTDNDSDTITYEIQISDVDTFAHINQSDDTLATSDYTATTLKDSIWYWRVKAITSYANSSYTSSWNFTVDTAPPSIDWDFLTEANGAYKSQNYIESNVTWTETNFNNITWNINGTKTTYTTATYNHTESGLSDGNYSYNVTIYDKAGNSNTTTTRTIILDTLEPKIYLESVSKTEIEKGGSLRVNVLIDDENINITKFYSPDFGNLTATNNYPEFYITCNSTSPCLTTNTGNFSFTSIWSQDLAGNINSTIISLNFTITEAVTPPAAEKQCILGRGYAYNVTFTAPSNVNYTIVRFRDMNDYTTPLLRNIMVSPQGSSQTFYMNGSWGSGNWDVYDSGGDTLYVDLLNNKTWTKTSAIKMRKSTADNFCSTLSYGGYSDWTLPSNETLQTLCQAEQCNGTCFDYEGENDWYGSTTTDASGDNQQIINFTSGSCNIIEETVNYDWAYVRCVRDETSPSTNTLTYRIAVNTTLNKTFDIRLGGHLIEYNYTNLTSDYFTNDSWDMRTVNISDFSSSGEGDLYKVMFKEEENESFFNLGLIQSLKLNAYCPSATLEIKNLEDGKDTLFLVSDEDIDEFRAVVDWDAATSYFRNIIPNSDRTIEMYLVDLTNQTLIATTFELEDLTGSFWPAYLRLQQYLNGTLKDIHSNWFDADKQSVTYLIENRRYVMKVGTATEVRSPGWITASATDTTKTITITAKLDFTTMEVPFDFINLSFYSDYNASQVCMSYEDAHKNTTSLKFFVYNASNEELLYNISSTSYNTTLCYTVPDNNGTYTLKAEIDHPEGSIIPPAITINMVQGIRKLIDLGLDELGEVLGLDSDTWYMIISVGMLTSTGLLFAASQSGTGAMILSLFALFFIYIGWLAVSWGVAAIMLIIAMFHKFTEGRKVT